ncbi:hypothetical protein [Streptomyces wuyuanensis]|uniref:hypothetical protein n=1 Tax=Streptomyces wuyuanensis TaxID=1196353 RepID=UPI0037147695
MEEPTPEEARTSISSAHAARATLQARGNWFRGYALAFTVGAFLLMLAMGTGNRLVALIGLCGWGALALTMALWSRTRVVVLREQKRRLGKAFAAWATAYGIALAVGLPTYSGVLAFWVAAALITPLPLLLAALLPLDQPRTQP